MSTWRVGRLSKWVVSRIISTLKEVLVGAMILITVKNSYLLSPPTFKADVGVKPVGACEDLV